MVSVKDEIKALLLEHGAPRVPETCQSMGRECFAIRERNSVFFRKYKSAELKLNLLSICLSSDLGCYLNYSANPIEDQLAGCWSRVDDDVWLVSQTADLRELIDWLRLGNWILYLSAKPQNEPFVASVGPKFVEFGRVLTEEVPLIVAAYHDSDAWYCCLQHPTCQS